MILARKAALADLGSARTLNASMGSGRVVCLAIAAPKHQTQELPERLPTEGNGMPRCDPAGEYVGASACALRWSIPHTIIVVLAWTT